MNGKQGLRAALAAALILTSITTLAGCGNGGGFFEINEIAQPSFVACSFGQLESNHWYFDESAHFDDCEFTEPNYEDFYGEYDYHVPVNGQGSLLSVLRE